MNTEKNTKGESYFSMNTIKAVAALTDVVEAKKIALTAVDSSSAKLVNKKKAELALRKAYNIDGLVTIMTNFFLAHPSENLGVI